MRLGANSLCAPASFRSNRGSALISAAIIALVMAIGIASYLQLSRNSLREAQRGTFFNTALNLAEAGLEEGLWRFNRMNQGVSTSLAWSGWTLSGNEAKFTLPAFNCDQNAIGTVRVYVRGYNGSLITPYVISQATITPFDGSPPLVRTLRVNLAKGAYFASGLVAYNGLSWSGKPSADSFSSSILNNTTGFFLPYPGMGARDNTTVIVASGTVSLGSQGIINGNLILGPSVVAPPANKVTGSITRMDVGPIRFPSYPSAGSLNRSHDLGSTIPSVLPRFGDLPASDGTFYYFCSDTIIGNTDIFMGCKVSIVGTNCSVGGDLQLHMNSRLKIYVDGPVNISSSSTANLTTWAGALEIFTTTTQPCNVGGNGAIYACIMAPYATLNCNGGGNSGMLVGSIVANRIVATGHMDFHYDEMLPFTAESLWVRDSWSEYQSAADRALVPSLTNDFLR